jgi:hypothetical protein
MGTTPEALVPKIGQDILCDFTRNDYHIDCSEVIALLNPQRLQKVEIVKPILCRNNLSVLISCGLL